MPLGTSLSLIIIFVAKAEIVGEKCFSIMPSFSSDHYTSCPNWIPSLPDPSIPFNQSPPSYEKSLMYYVEQTQLDPHVLWKRNPQYASRAAHI